MGAISVTKINKFKSKKVEKILNLWYNLKKLFGRRVMEWLDKLRKKIKDRMKKEYKQFLTNHWMQINWLRN